MTMTLVRQEPEVRRGTGLDPVLAAARVEVTLMSTLSTSHAPFRRIDRSSIRPGVRYRAVFPDSARTTPALGPYLAGLAMAGVAVRTVSHVPMDAVVVDREVAVLPAEGSASVAIMRLPSAVTAQSELFERIWPTAVPLGSGDLGDAELSDRERALLDLLSLGATDETAAHQLGVSVRTVRRAMSDLMNRLGARSRFQAGVKAADRGWLIDVAS